MTELLDDLQRIGLTALFNPTFLFLLVVLFFLGRLVGWMTRGLNIWKFIALGYFAIFLFRPLQDAGLVIGGIFVLGVASMYMDLFREIFRWSGSIIDVFYAFRSPDVYRDIDRMEREIEDLKRQLHAAQSDGGGDAASAQSATQNQWRQQAQARAQKSQDGQKTGSGPNRSAQAATAGDAKTSRASAGKSRAGEKEKRRRTGSGKRASQTSGASSRTSSKQRGTGKSSGSQRKRADTQDRAQQSRGTHKAQQKHKPGSGGRNKSSSSSQNQQNQRQQSQRTQPGPQRSGTGMAPSLRDHYLKILELAPGQTYTAQELKSAWRKMAFKTHPDRGGSAAAFNEAFNAYKALK